MSFAGGVFVALLSFPIIFVISVVISFFAKFEYSFWDRVWATAIITTFLLPIILGIIWVLFLVYVFFGCLKTMGAFKSYEIIVCCLITP